LLTLGRRKGWQRWKEDDKEQRIESKNGEGVKGGALNLAIFLLSLSLVTSGWMDMVVVLGFSPQGSKQG
jgi:hypothetical protein